MYHRVTCGYGCEGTPYRIGVTTVTMHGEKVKVCSEHGMPVRKMPKSEVNGRGNSMSLKAPLKKPPNVRKVTFPIVPAFAR